MCKDRRWEAKGRKREKELQNVASFPFFLGENIKKEKKKNGKMKENLPRVGSRDSENLVVPKEKDASTHTSSSLHRSVASV